MGTDIVHRRSKIPAYVEQKYYYLSESRQSFAEINFIVQAFCSPPTRRAATSAQQNSCWYMAIIFSGRRLANMYARR
jgi:hypothetical protein